MGVCVRACVSATRCFISSLPTGSAVEQIVSFASPFDNAAFAVYFYQ